MSPFKAVLDDAAAPLKERGIDVITEVELLRLGY